MALVGSSGAGKTTVLNLLLRSFDPQQGRLLIGGVDVQDMSLAGLRSLFALVSQDTYLFHATVAENLRLARLDADQDTIEAATRAANAHDFITRLPDGYDTVVGEPGRACRAVNASAWPSPDPVERAPILLLDEPTSSVDAENEELIQEALRRLARGRTTPCGGASPVHSG